MKSSIRKISGSPKPCEPWRGRGIENGKKKKLRTKDNNCAQIEREAFLQCLLRTEIDKDKKKFTSTLPCFLISFSNEASSMLYLTNINQTF